VPKTTRRRGAFSYPSRHCEAARRGDVPQRRANPKKTFRFRSHSAMDNQSFGFILELADPVIHTNSHNHALVQNPFAWDEESEDNESE
jgi:hypothetical protein